MSLFTRRHSNWAIAIVYYGVEININNRSGYSRSIFNNYNLKSAKQTSYDVCEASNLLVKQIDQLCVLKPIFPNILYNQRREVQI